MASKNDNTNLPNMDLSEEASTFAEVFYDRLHTTVTDIIEQVSTNKEGSNITYSNETARILAEIMDIAGVSYDIELSHLENNLVSRLQRMGGNTHKSLRLILDIIKRLLPTKRTKDRARPRKLPLKVCEPLIKHLKDKSSPRLVALASQITTQCKSRQQVGHTWIKLIRAVISDLDIRPEHRVHLDMLLSWLFYQWQSKADRISESETTRQKVGSYLSEAAKCVISSVIVEVLGISQDISPGRLFKSWTPDVIYTGSKDLSAYDDGSVSNDANGCDTFNPERFYNVAVCMTATDCDVAFVSIKGTTQINDWEKNMDSVWEPIDEYIKDGQNKRQAARPKVWRTGVSTKKRVKPTRSKASSRKKTSIGSTKVQKTKKGPMVSRGFLYKLLAVLPALHKHMEGLCKRAKQRKTNPRVVVCGHSLGGAQAVLYTYYVNTVFPEIEVITITAGGPRSGADTGYKTDIQWTVAYEAAQKKTGSLTLRLCNFGDIVPEVPVYRPQEYQEAAILGAQVCAQVATVGALALSGPAGAVGAAITGVIGGGLFGVTLGKMKAAKMRTGFMLGKTGKEYYKQRNVREIPSLLMVAINGAKDSIWSKERVRGTGSYRHVGTGLLLRYQHVGFDWDGTPYKNRWTATRHNDANASFANRSIISTAGLSLDRNLRLTRIHKNLRTLKRHLLPDYREFVLQGRTPRRGIYAHDCSLLSGPRHEAAPVHRGICPTEGFGDFSLEGCPCISDCEYYRGGYGHRCEIDSACAKELGSSTWHPYHSKYLGKCVPPDATSTDFKNEKATIIALRAGFLDAIRENVPKDDIDKRIFQWLIDHRNRDTWMNFARYIKLLKSTDPRNSELRTYGNRLVDWLNGTYDDVPRKIFLKEVGPTKSPEKNKALGLRLSKLWQRIENMRHDLEQYGCTHNLRKVPFARIAKYVIEGKAIADAKASKEPQIAKGRSIRHRRQILRKPVIGSRADVMNDRALKTSGGLTKKDLMYKSGKIVSRKKSAAAKQRMYAKKK